MVPLAFPVVFFLSLFNKKIRRSLQHRFQSPERLEFKMMNRGRAKAIWFHLASSGEFLMTRPLVEKLQTELGRDACTFVYTFTSPSGIEWLRKNNPEEIFDFYPFDDPYHVDKTINAIRPYMLILIRYDIWPNLIWLCSKYSVPVFLVSAIIKENSRKLSNPLFRSFFRSVYSEINFLYPLNNESKKQFNLLLVDSKNLKVSGEIKIDSVLLRQKESTSRKLALPLQNFFSFVSKKFSHVILGASVWQTEEEWLIESFAFLYPPQKAARQNENLLILAPHDPSEHSLKNIVSLCQKYSLSYSLFSNWESNKNFQVLVLDRVGILMNFFAVSDFVVVGLGKGGLHNFLEPMAWKLPLTFRQGQWQDPLAEELVKKKLLTPIANAQELQEQIIKVLSSKKFSKEQGTALFQILLDKAGISEKVAQNMIQQMGMTSHLHLSDNKS